MICEELFFLSFLYIKLFELGIEVALNHRSAVTHHKVNLLEFPLWSSSFERTDDAFVLLISFYCDPSGRLPPEKRFTKKDPGSRLYRVSSFFLTAIVTSMS